MNYSMALPDSQREISQSTVYSAWYIGVAKILPIIDVLQGIIYMFLCVCIVRLSGFTSLNNTVCTQ